ncbi:MAG: hypothetical protein KF690_06545, partial [Bacteroidetes bacterium]|nr:hypothetical protein [Bacteroidota bacterium]
MKSLILSYLLLFPFVLSAQVICLYDSSETLGEEPQANTSCEVSLNYAPLVSSHHPNLTVRVMVHVLQKPGCGSGGVYSDSTCKNYYDTGNPSTSTYPLIYNYLDSINGINKRLKDLHTHSYPSWTSSAPYIQDSRIRIYLHGIKYHQTEHLDPINHNNITFKYDASTINSCTGNNYHPQGLFKNIYGLVQFTLFPQFVTNDTNLSTLEKDSCLHIFLFGTPHLISAFNTLD